jgi:hypothetical protein
MKDSYRDWVEDMAAELGSDGCTGVSGAYVWCCKEHDVLWRLGMRRDGTLISKDEANLIFRSCIQRSSPFGWLSPMAWWRWIGLKWFGRRSVPVPLMSPPASEAEVARARIIAEVEAASSMHRNDDR